MDVLICILNPEHLTPNPKQGGATTGWPCDENFPAEAISGEFEEIRYRQVASLPPYWVAFFTEVPLAPLVG